MTRLIGIAAVAAGIGFAQTPPGGSAPNGFEVSSIKAVPPMRPAFVDEAGKQHTMYQFLPGGRFVVRNGTLRFLITTAFHIKDFQLVGAPSWAGSERYDVEAKAFTNISPDSMLPLVQALLVERFGLGLHRETRDLPVYHLITAKPGN